MIFQYLRYQDYLKYRFEEQGRGMAKRLSEYLGVSSVAVSQVLNCQRDLSQENAYKASEFLGLTTFEKKYFMLMVDFSKAGTVELKNYFEQELLLMQKESEKIKNRYRDKNELSDEDKALFYSDKIYSAIRMGTSLDSINSLSDIANYFQLPEEKVKDILEFLLTNELCIEENKKIQRGTKSTFIPASSPYIKNHHRNWRLHSIERASILEEDELMYTAPMSLSHKDFKKIRGILLRTIQEAVEILGPSEDETLACLNIDFIKI